MLFPFPPYSKETNIKTATTSKTRRQSRAQSFLRPSPIVAIRIIPLWRQPLRLRLVVHALLLRWGIPLLTRRIEAALLALVLRWWELLVRKVCGVLVDGRRVGGVVLLLLLLLSLLLEAGAVDVAGERRGKGVEAVHCWR